MIDFPFVRKHLNIVSSLIRTERESVQQTHMCCANIVSMYDPREYSYYGIKTGNSYQIFRIMTKRLPIIVIIVIDVDVDICEADRINETQFKPAK